ncbi:MAG: hypothetical protein QOI35_2765, partial [Cryptosporangiaceae bacterium]|nr:hypothetical protein [Cryptosporangiaceae bacterium]
MTEAPPDRSASRALLGRGSIYTLATAVQLAGAVLVIPALTRVLPKDELGIATVGVVITATIGLLLAAGLPGAITREYFQGPEGERNVGAMVTLSAGLSVLLGGVAFALGPLWAGPLHGFRPAFMVATATAITYSVIVTGQAVQRARNQPGRFVLVVALNVVGGQLLGILLVLTVSRTAVAYLAGIAVASVAGAVLSLVWCRPSIRGLGDRVALKRWFAIALPTVPHMAALYLMTAGDRYIVLHGLNEGGAAEYNVSYQVGALGITLVAAANNAWAPLIYGAPEKTRWQTLAITTADMLRVAAIVAAGLAMAAPLGLWLAAPSGKYDVGALTPVVALTALATVPYVLYLASAHVLFQRGRTVALIWISPLAVLASLAVKAVVLPRFGLAGIALVTAVAYGLLATLVGWERRKLATVPWHRRWPEFVGAAVLCVAGALIPLTWAGAAVRVVITIALLALLARTGKHLLADRKSATAEATAAQPPATPS